MAELAIVALTPNGLALGQRIATALGRGNVKNAAGSARATLEDVFRAGRPMVCIMALGIVVRILGPLTRDKTTEPAVVVVDEAGRFAVSVLGGHRGGANELATEVARAIAAVPVITTASEALQLPAVDLIGRSRGWRIESQKALTTVSAAVVRGEPVAVFQEAGSPNWWQEFGDWPPHFQRESQWPQTGWAAVLVISDRCSRTSRCPTVVFRPRTLVLGVGCRRGVPADEIESMFQRTCEAHDFSPLSLGAVATASLKADEPGLQEFAARHEVPLRAFSLDELAAVTLLPTPSETVRRKIGVFGVAEPAAMLAAECRTLLVPKQKGERITMALARREET